MSRQAPLGAKVNSLRWFLCIMSILFTIIGLCMVVAGGLSMADKTHGMFVDPSVKVGRAMIIFGVGIMLLSLMGCVGAFRRRSKILYVYLLFLIFFILSQIALVVYAQIDTDFPVHIWDALSSSSRTTLQKELGCCQWEPVPWQSNSCPVDGGEEAAKSHVARGILKSCYLEAGKDDIPSSCWDSIVTKPLMGGIAEFSVSLSVDITTARYLSLYVEVHDGQTDRHPERPAAGAGPPSGGVMVSIRDVDKCYPNLYQSYRGFSAAEGCYGVPSQAQKNVCKSALISSADPPCDSCSPADGPYILNGDSVRLHELLDDGNGELWPYTLIGPWSKPGATPTDGRQFDILVGSYSGSGYRNDWIVKMLVLQTTTPSPPLRSGVDPLTIPECPDQVPVISQSHSGGQAYSMPAVPGCRRVVSDQVAKYRGILIGVGVAGLMIQLVTLCATIVVIRGVSKAEKAGSAHHQYLSQNAYTDHPGADVHELQTIEPRY